MGWLNMLTGNNPEGETIKDKGEPWSGFGGPAIDDPNKRYKVEEIANESKEQMQARVKNEVAGMKYNLGRLAFSGIPLSPESIGRRKTIFKEVVKNQVYTLDQLQGIVNVNTPVRSVIIALAEGGLFVNNPVAPTDECIEYMRQLEEKHGEVKYITLASLAVEHKGTAGAYSAKFPNAEVYL